MADVAMIVLQILAVFVVVGWVIAGLGVCVVCGCDRRWPRGLREWVVILPWLWMLVFAAAIALAMGEKIREDPLGQPRDRVQD